MNNQHTRSPTHAVKTGLIQGACPRGRRRGSPLGVLISCQRGRGQDGLPARERDLHARARVRGDMIKRMHANAGAKLDVALAALAALNAHSTAMRALTPAEIVPVRTRFPFRADPGSPCKHPAVADPLSSTRSISAPAQIAADELPPLSASTSRLASGDYSSGLRTGMAVSSPTA